MKKTIPIILVGYFGIFAVVLFAMGQYWDARHSPPEQPIAFPHDVHAGKLNLDCKYCHQYVDKSIHATVPAVQICMNCHKNAALDRPEVQKLVDYWDRQEPIPWNRVFKLNIRNYVYFSHKRHIKAGVDCSVCHGNMKVVKQVRMNRTFHMGFCVNCHKANNAPIDCWTCHK